jgi:hypothetical protein
LLLGRGRITSIDEWHVYGTAESLAERGSWQLAVEGIDRTYSRYSIVPSILAVPFCKLAGPIADRLVHDGHGNSSAGPKEGLTRERVLMAAATMATSFVTAATATVLFLGLCRLGIGPAAALAASFVYGVGTLALPYSGSLYVQPIAALALTCVVTSAALGRTVALAVSICLLLSIRAELLAILPLLGWHAVRYQRPVGHSLGWLVAGAVAGIAANVLVNTCRGDHWLLGDYGSEAFSTPLWVGLWGVLFSSGKGLLWFAPAAAAGLVLLPRFVVKSPRAGLLVAGVAIMFLAMVACWWTWHGAWSWGPRLLLPLIPVLMFPVASVFDAWRHQSAGMRGVLFVTVLASVALQFPGLLRDPSFDRMEMGALIAGNENESIYVPHVGPWCVESDAPVDLLLCRVWRGEPQLRWGILIVAATLLFVTLLLSWGAVRAAGVTFEDMRCLLPRLRPQVLLMAACTLLVISMPTALQWLLVAQEPGGSELPLQFRSFRQSNASRLVGSLYIPLRGDYLFYQQGPGPAQFLLDGRPIFSAVAGPAGGIVSGIEAGFHRLEIERSGPGSLNALYWTTPGNAHYKERIPRLYLAGPQASWQRRWAVRIAHWKWSVWAVALSAFLFVVIRDPERAD